MKGGEQKGYRPVVIISGNLLNENAPLCIICPLTSKLKHYHGNVILSPNRLNRLKKKSEILTFHIRSIAKERLVKKMGEINVEELERIKSCLNDLLRY